MAKTESTNGGVELTDMLFLVFLVLKLTHVIDWSWWWITCPLWGTIALVIIGCIIYLIFETAFSAGKGQRNISKTEHTKHESKFMEKLNKSMAESEAKRDQN